MSLMRSVRDCSHCRGGGEEAAVPILLRRLADELGIYGLPIGKPVYQHSTQLVREEGFKRSLRLAAYAPGVRAVLVLFDSDDACARNVIPSLTKWASTEVGHIPVAIVLARREYEAWFLSALESLRGIRGIRADAFYPGDPEAKRDAKGQLFSTYTPTADQAALTAKFDLAQAYRRCSSFRKLVNELCRILEATGHTPTIPAEWQASPDQPSGIG